MALQATHTSSSRPAISMSNAVALAIAGLNIYWSEIKEQHSLEWEKWIELFRVVTMAKHSISQSKLTRTSGGERVSAFVGGLY